MTDPFVAGRSGGLGRDAGGDRHSPNRRARRRLRRKETGGADAAMPSPNSPTKAEVARNDLFDPRWSVWGAPFGGGSTTAWQCSRWDRTMRPTRAFGLCRRRRLPDLAGDRWPVLRSPAAAPISASTVSAPDVRTCSRPAPSCATHAGPAYVTPRAGLWLAGRHDRPHRHRRRHRSPARAVQRQRLFGPHRRRLPLRRRHGWASRPMPRASSPPTACRPMPSRCCRASARFALNLCGQGRHGVAHRTRRSHRQVVRDVEDGILTLRGRAAWAHDFNTDRNVARGVPDAAGRGLRRQRRRAGARSPRSTTGVRRDEMAERLVRRRTFQANFPT